MSNISRSKGDLTMKFGQLIEHNMRSIFLEKFKYLENKTSFQDGIKSIFHYFQRCFVESNKTFFLESDSPNLWLLGSYLEYIWWESNLFLSVICDGPILIVSYSSAELFSNGFKKKKYVTNGVFSLTLFFNCRSSHGRCSVKKLFLKISQNSQENNCQSFFLNKVAKKETLAQVLPCKFCEFFNNTFFTEHLWWLLL